MPEDKQQMDSSNAMPELSRFREVELSAEDRHSLWQSIEERMEDWSEQRPRRTRRRILWGATAAAAALVGVVVAYQQLPFGEMPSPLFQTPSAEHPNVPNPIQTPENNQLTLDEPAQQSLVLEIQNLASHGKIPNCPFTADQDRIDEVYKAWGNPDHQDLAGKGMYATYDKRLFAFGFNKSNLIFDVRTYAPDVQALQLATITKVLGKPDHINQYNDASTSQDIYVYKAGDRFELQLVFPKVTQQNPNPKLDHVSVYCPQDTTTS